MNMVEQYKFLYRINKQNFVEFLRFITLGSLAVFLNFFSRIILSAEFNYFISIILAQCIGMFAAFVLFRNYLFAPSNRSFQWLRFIMVNLFSLVIILSVSHILVDYLLPTFGIIKYKYEIAHFIGIGSTVVSSFILHKFWTFS